MRHYERSGDTIKAKEWKLRLSKGIQKKIGTLKQDNHRSLAAVLDMMLPLIGLWPSVKLGPLYRWLSTKCDEVSWLWL